MGAKNTSPPNESSFDIISQIEHDTNDDNGRS
jgi:hypothetical protein